MHYLSDQILRDHRIASDRASMVALDLSKIWSLLRLALDEWRHGCHSCGYGICMLNAIVIYFLLLCYYVQRKIIYIIYNLYIILVRYLHMGKSAGWGYFSPPLRSIPQLWSSSFSFGDEMQITKACQQHLGIGQAVSSRVSHKPTLSTPSNRLEQWDSEIISWAFLGQVE